VWICGKLKEKRLNTPDKGEWILFIPCIWGWMYESFYCRVCALIGDKNVNAEKVNVGGKTVENREKQSFLSTTFYKD